MSTLPNLLIMLVYCYARDWKTSDLTRHSRHKQFCWLLSSQLSHRIGCGLGVFGKWYGCFMISGQSGDPFSVTSPRARMWSNVTTSCYSFPVPQNSSKIVIVWLSWWILCLLTPRAWAYHQSGFSVNWLAIVWSSNWMLKLNAKTDLSCVFTIEINVRCVRCLERSHIYLYGLHPLCQA